jgi:hypothetical protein
MPVDLNQDFCGSRRGDIDLLDSCFRICPFALFDGGVLLFWNIYCSMMRSSERYNEGSWGPGSNLLSSTEAACSGVAG